jgi:uridine monophosphate synthetase
MNFFEKLDAAVTRNQSLLCIGLDPDPARIPARYLTADESIEGTIEAIFSWNRAIIEQTVDLACVYKPNIAFYEALGRPGMELLRRTLALIPKEIPVILDAKRGDIGSTAAAYARACFEDLGVDAVTLSPYLGRDSVDPFAAYEGKGLFVLCHTSNPSAGDFQTLEISDWRTLDREPNQPLYIRVATETTGWSPNVGLVVGATYPEALADVRAASPDAWFLVPGIGAQGGDLAATLAAGLRADGKGLLINVSRGVGLAENHGEAARKLRDEIRNEIEGLRDSSQASISQSPNLPISDLDSLILALPDLGAVQFGDFTLASGKESPFYIDLRLLVSRPDVLALAARAYANILAGIEHDRIAGVPYAALPIGTAVSLEADVPLIYPRKEVKAYGMGKQIEGAWNPGDRIVVIEDLITSGGSIIKSVEAMREAGMVIEDAIVLIDREQGGVENLAAAGIKAHSVFKLDQILDVLVENGKLSEEKRTEVLTFIRMG